MLNCRIILALSLYFIVMKQAMVTTLKNISILNNFDKTVITLALNKRPTYIFFPLHNPERIVVNIHQSNSIQVLSLKFENTNYIKFIRSTMLFNNKRSLRLVFNLTCKSYVHVITQRVSRHYNIILTLTKKHSHINKLIDDNVFNPLFKTLPSHEILENKYAKQLALEKNFSSVIAPILIWKPYNYLYMLHKPIVVAIDAGHGGKDPGATGLNGLCEKNITIIIARKLKKLLAIDGIFKPILIRNGDYFISVNNRSRIARRNGANIFISIHTDSVPDCRAKGASIWILSNQRANIEIINWLGKYKRQLAILGRNYNFLSTKKKNLYFSKLLLDLQFYHSQQVSYDIGLKMLSQLRQVCSLHKKYPERASFGALCSPDIPSLLVETGFISNLKEEQLLNNEIYQDKIANAINLGLRTYFSSYFSTLNFIVKNQSNYFHTSTNYHIVKRGETLYSITRQYGINIKAIYALNNLKKNSIFIGQSLFIPISNNTQRFIASS